LNEKRRSWLKQFLEEAQALSRYDVGETIDGLARKLNRRPSEILKLNSNENFFVPKEFLKRVLSEVVEEIDPRIYPRDERLELEEAVSRYVKVSARQIVTGEGSDQLIDLVSRAFLKHGDVALSISPTFSMYQRCVKIQGAKFVVVPLREGFSLDINGILDSAKSGAKLLFLCSPNNPTANQFEPEEIQHLLEEFEGLVIVDEAYAEFSEQSIVPLAEKNENLIVLRTFSKAFGLAGLRLGYAISNTELASTLTERYQMPYSAALTAIKTGIKLLERMDTIKKAIQELKVERKNMIERLNDMSGVHAFNSKTNFVLVRVGKSSDWVCNGLLNRGIIIRNLGRVLKFDNCLRVTIAPPEMTERFLVELGRVLDEQSV